MGNERVCDCTAAEKRTKHDVASTNKDDIKLIPLACAGEGSESS